MDGPDAAAGLEALRQLKSVEAPLFLSASEELAHAGRLASQYLFSALKPFSSNCPLPQLVTEGFDAEQIWPQIEAQSEPLIKALRGQLRKFEKNPEEIKRQFDIVNKKKVSKTKVEDEEIRGLEREYEEVERESEDDDMEALEEDDEDDDVEEDEDEEEDDAEISEDDEEEEEGDGLKEVEDKFLKIKELEKYLEEDEAREYGINKEEKKSKGKRKRGGDDEDTTEDEEDQEEDEEGDEEDEEDELGLMGMDDDEDDEEDGLENARYEDFFRGKKKSNQKRTSKLLDGSEGSEMDEGLDDANNNRKQTLSTHEKELQKLRSQIEEMEKSNLEPKDWTMQGEITAAKRAKNSALEVDLDFEHNVRPAPVITEEVTASLEELIQKRILEGRFDDVQKPPTLPSRAPKELKEMDENKSKKGLAEIYEEEYVQKTGLVATAMSFSDERKKEASMLFKQLCLKLDALSHFHFTPKPVIEDMSIQSNVPALAMEEIAPVAVSDAAMLAPEEVFAGKRDIKEKTELTQVERKRKRAKKKRKFKAESVKKMARKAQNNVLSNTAEGKEDS